MVIDGLIHLTHNNGAHRPALRSPEELSSGLSKTWRCSVITSDQRHWCRRHHSHHPQHPAPVISVRSCCHKIRIKPSELELRGDSVSGHVTVNKLRHEQEHLPHYGQQGVNFTTTLQTIYNLSNLFPQSAPFHYHHC